MTTAIGANGDGDWAYDYVVRWLVEAWRVEPSSIFAEMPLFILEVDSLDLVEFAMRLEDEEGFDASHIDQVGAPDTVGDLANLVRSLRRDR